MRRIGYILITAMTAIALAAPTAGAATTLQPGVTFDYQPLLGGCTLGFVLEGGGKTYFATAAHCMTHDGRARDIEGTEFGTFALIGHLDETREASFTSDPVGATQTVVDDTVRPQWKIESDFALIEVDAEDVHRVRPDVRGHPGFPTGVTAPDETLPGEPVQVSGYPRYTQEVDSATVREQRRGVLTTDETGIYGMAAPVWWGDSGGPVVQIRTGEAIGLVSTLCTRGSACYAEGPTVQGILEKAASRGFELTLKTV